MRLKQLEVKGFKSFAKQTVINFEADVIGIVGPNGSGKSNIVDAIRWVLGEQKGSELRLDKMASVIYNGSKQQKAGNLASVSLTFDNDRQVLPTEYGTVTITRMLYRSGDSEYRLNGVTCRLKDIRNLFLDTGIGSNSYAIIALGMVDDILADKDNSRRRMFEQAAGIAKYKSRKKEALRKLKRTGEDLDRVEDLLAEIERNLAGLEKQARRARKFRELKSKYRELSLLLTGIRAEKLRIERERLNEQVGEALEQYRTADTHTTRLENDLSEQRRRHLDQEKRVGERQRKLGALVGELRSLENEGRLLAQRREFVVRQREQLHRRMMEATEQAATLAGEIEDYTPRLAAAGTEVATREQARTAAEAALTDVRQGHAGLKTRLDERLQRQRREERRIFELEKQRAIGGSQTDTLARDIARAEQELQHRQAEYQQTHQRLQGLHAELATLQARATDLSEQETSRQRDIEQAETHDEQVRTQLTAVNRRLDARRNEYRLTKSMVDSMEGFPEAVRYLAGNREWTTAKELPPLFGDLLEVAPDYRTAVESYLDPFLSYYVVVDAAAARTAITLLRERGKGRASFFVLGDLPEAPPPHNIPPSDGRPATEVVQVEAPYRPLLAHLLRDVVVTPAGDFHRGDYLFGGGSAGLFEGKRIGRKRNLERLAGQIKQDEQQAAKLEATLAEGRRRLGKLREQRPDRELDKVQQQLSQLRREEAGLTAREENFISYRRETQARNEDRRRRIRKIEATDRQTEAELLMLRSGIDELRAELSEADQEYRQLSEELSAASSRFNEANVALIQQQNQVAALEQELAYRQQRAEELERQRAQDKEKLVALDREARTFDEQEKILTRNLATLRADKENYQTTLTDAEQAYFAARTALGKLEDELRRQGRRRQDAQVRVNQLKEKLGDLRFTMNSLEERLRIEFELNLDELANVEIEEWTGTVAELEGKVERLRGRLAGYGEINPLAVEAYDEMRQRFDDITIQRDDILAAKDTLLGTLREIEENATAQFMDAFIRVREHFIEVFRSLFTENDTCDLILLDPQDPLESSIEIIARPKGKRPQTISQLSGGEKTLTATALLFALYLLKPAPFCIFDEVDAPLDDANISKFNRIVRKFSRESQFIVVTHNKLTMEAVDHIYGVYTTARGGSGVVPVEFTELAASTSFSVA